MSFLSSSHTSHWSATQICSGIYFSLLRRQFLTIPQSHKEYCSPTTPTFSTTGLSYYCHRSHQNTPMKPQAHLRLMSTSLLLHYFRLYRLLRGTLLCLTIMRQQRSYIHTHIWSLTSASQPLQKPSYTLYTSRHLYQYSPVCVALSPSINALLKQS